MPRSEDTATTVMKTLEAAWNAADGASFGAAFADDADFVDIRGDYSKGRAAIAAGHQAVLDTVYKGSTVDYQLIQARQVGPDLTLAHVAGKLTAPAGPMAGVNRATFSMLIDGSGGAARIVAFHNTMAQG